MQHDDDVEPRANRRALHTNDGAQLTFQTVPDRRPFEAAPRPESDLRPGGIIGERSHREEVAARPPSPSVYSPEGLRPF